MIDCQQITFLEFDHVTAWAQAAARALADLLKKDLSRQGSARLLLSGGTTPAVIYEALAKQPLDWPHIDVGLVDERWLLPEDDASNAWLIQQSLIQHAPEAVFTPLVRPGKELADCVHDANLLQTHTKPATAAVLGMGNDGHTASLFPGAVNLAKVLASPFPYAALDATGCPGANQWPLRITLTPAGLKTAARRLLLIRGQSKRDVLNAALASNDPLKYPIRLAIDLPGEPLWVFWCP